MTDSGREPLFLAEAARILNAGQTRSLLLTGNVHDLLPCPGEAGEGVEWLPLVDLLVRRWSVPDRLLLVVELNGPIRFRREGDRETLRAAWVRWRTGLGDDERAVRRMVDGKPFVGEEEAVAAAFDDHLQRAVGNPTVAFELLRQLCLCSRTMIAGRPALGPDLVLVVEAADLALPEAPVPSLSQADRRRIAICRDWFLDPGFMDGGDSVVLLAESRSLLNQRVARLPQLLEVAVPAPDTATRRAFVDSFARARGPETTVAEGGPGALAESTAGLSLLALRQLLRGASHRRSPIDRSEVVAKVGSFLETELGEGVVEVKKPSHTLDDAVGFRRLKTFLRTELVPRIDADPAVALPGAAVAGPIGGGKTFLFEALAGELGIPVLVLKSIRSQWFGQTDVLFERLRRAIEALDRVLIFVDEADTQFGGVGPSTHDTERRLTGRIQAMMSDPALRGRVFWLLMTARIHRLSPDLRRPGRVGDLIIPVLDPAGEDRAEFLDWVLAKALGRDPSTAERDGLDGAMPGSSAAAFAALRSLLAARVRTKGEPLELAEALAVAGDILPPAIGETRRYQTLQALVNCTRRSLLPDPGVGPEGRERWLEEIRSLEASGIS